LLGTSVTLDLNALSDAEIRHAPDGWHALLRMRGVEHRLWLKEPPLTTSTYVAELPLDDDFEMRAHAARRLWRALNGKPPVRHSTLCRPSGVNDWRWLSAHSMREWAAIVTA